MIWLIMTALEGVPGKVLAVHVSYRSRAAEHGTMPAWPSCFLKPSSSLADSGDPVARPPGCELLAFEGEVALVIRHRPAGSAGRTAGITWPGSRPPTTSRQPAEQQAAEIVVGADGFTR